RRDRGGSDLSSRGERTRRAWRAARPPKPVRLGTGVARQIAAGVSPNARSDAPAPSKLVHRQMDGLLTRALRRAVRRNLIGRDWRHWADLDGEVKVGLLRIFKSPRKQLTNRPDMSGSCRVWR